jgi:hypothetical protein
MSFVQGMAENSAEINLSGIIKEDAPADFSSFKSENQWYGCDDGAFSLYDNADQEPCYRPFTP